MSAPPGRRYELDRWLRRRHGGRLLVGGAPARLVRLSEPGAQLLDQLLAGGAPASAAPLRNRLRAHGMLHPVVESADRGEGAISFVIPNRDGGAELAALVAGLREWGPVVVVDDGSRDGSAELAAEAGATVVANSHQPGPAGARNAGLATATAEHVAFLDADCRCGGEWAAALAALLEEEPELAIVAPRVRSAAGPGPIAAYERGLSPLDMGPDPSRCGPGRRVAYVPSAAIVARRSALAALGGFDEGLRFGEDVELCLRLGAAGWAVRYAPGLAVEHRPRPSPRAFAAQRFHYGGSAAALDRRHPGRVPPLLVNRQAVALWGAAGAGLSRSAKAGAAAAALGLGWSAAAATRAGRGQGRAALAAIALRGQLAGTRHLSRALLREWLPLTVAASLGSRRARRLAALALAVDLAASHRPETPVAAHLGLRPLDNLSYAAGFWRGLVGQRRPGALLPRFGRRSG